MVASNNNLRPLGAFALAQPQGFPVLIPPSLTKYGEPTELSLNHVDELCHSATSLLAK
jgi:hypothetical protein